MSKMKEKSLACPRGSVGAIVSDKNGAFLALYRKSFPQGLAFVAGHKEEGEHPEETLKREIREEAGIEVQSFNLIFHKTFPNPCKSGFNVHEWWVYDVTSWHGTPVNKEPKKHEFVVFMPPREIRQYLEKKDFDPAWGNFIFPVLSAMPQFSSLTK